MKIAYLYICLLFPLISVAQTSPVDKNGKLHVCGLHLCNDNNDTIQLKGMSTHGIQWYGWGDCLTGKSLDTLAYSWKADIIRASLYVQEGGYETNPSAFLNQMNTIIDEATSRGLYVLIDWHMLTPGDPNENLDNAKAFFDSIATKHKDKNNLIYDIANEPNNVSWAKIKTYAEIMIPFIQNIDDDAVILCGTHGWGSLGISDGKNAKEITDNPIVATNFMYTFHFYAASHQQTYLNELDWASDTIPIFVTEWGTQEATGDGVNDFEMAEKYVDLMEKKKISWTNWNFSDDHRTGAVWKENTCATADFSSANLKEAGIWVRDKIRGDQSSIPSHNCPELSISTTHDLCGIPDTLYSNLPATDTTTFTWSLNNEVLQNEDLPYLVITSPGSYNLEVTTTSCETLSSTIEVNDKRIIPTINEASICQGNTATISIAGTSENYNWFLDSTTTDTLHTGDEYTTPSLNENQSYYITTSNNIAIDSGGIIERINTVSSASTGWYNNPSEFLYTTHFDVKQKISLQSIDVYSSNPQTLNLRILDNNDKVLWTSSQSIQSGKQTIAIGFTLDKATDYRMDAQGTTGSLWLDVFENESYPIDISYLLSIQNIQASWGIEQWSGHFYNWKIESYPQNSICGRTRVDVAISLDCEKDCNGDINGTASIDNCGVCSGGNTNIPVNVCTSIEPIPSKSFALYPNPCKDILYIETDELIESITIFDVFGRNILHTSETFSSLDVSRLVKGVYFLKLNDSLQQFIKEE